MAGLLRQPISIARSSLFRKASRTDSGQARTPSAKSASRTGDQPAEVIGVVGDIRTVQLDEPPLMMVYVPYWFNAISVPSSASFVLRTATEPATFVSEVRRPIHSIDPDVPITSLDPMTQIVSQSLDPRRFPMFLSMSFALFSLVLASLGIFGVVGYSVEQRSQEFGIRMALGAGAANLLRMVVHQGLTPVLVGLAAGVVAAGVRRSADEQPSFWRECARSSHLRDCRTCRRYRGDAGLLPPRASRLSPRSPGRIAIRIGAPG
jgi:hypothetical protein